MLIILSLYAILLWLVFSRLKLVRWGWVSGTLAVLGGTFILDKYKVDQLTAALARAKQQVLQL